MIVTVAAPTNTMRTKSLVVTVNGGNRAPDRHPRWRSPGGVAGVLVILDDGGAMWFPLEGVVLLGRRGEEPSNENVIMS